MPKTLLSEVNEVIQQNTFRRSLKLLQVSADEQGLAGNNMSHSDDKTSLKNKQPKSTAKTTVAEKENVFEVRRSKRKVVADKVNYVDSPEEPKTSKTSAKTKAKKSTFKSKKGRSTSTAGKKNEQKSVLNQTKLDFVPVAANTDLNENPDVSQSNNPAKNIASTSSTEITEDSGIDPSCGASDQSSTIPFDEVSIVTGDTPPLKYWQLLAEQRRLVVENVLHENELLHDQLAVLEAENSQLKQLVREAENLAQVLHDALD